MKKNTVIYLVAGIVALIIIGFSIYFAVAHNNTSDNRYDNKNERIPTNSKKTDVKINLQNGVELYLQDEIKDYCFYKTDDVKCTIKMPEGLVDFVNDVLKD